MNSWQFCCIVELVNWRGLLASKDVESEELASLDDNLAQMVTTDEWKSILAQRGWVDLYQNSADFTAFLTEERPRIEGLLQELGLTT